jgi:hypothetical protein
VSAPEDGGTPEGPLAARIVGALAVLANAVGVFFLFTNAVALTEQYERAVLLVLFMLEGLGFLAIYAGVLLWQGRRLGLWLLCASLPLQTAVNLFVGFPAAHAWLPLAGLAVVAVTLATVWRQLR